MIGGAGGWTGPDLSAVGTTLPLDRIVEEVVWPRRHIKEGYTTTMAVLKDGRVIKGYEEKTRAGEGELLLRDLTTGAQHRIRRSDLLAEESAGTAMPDDLTMRLETKELLDLLRFLSVLGAPGDYDVGKRNYIRTWERTTSHPRSAAKPALPENLGPWERVLQSRLWRVGHGRHRHRRLSIRPCAHERVRHPSGQATVPPCEVLSGSVPGSTSNRLKRTPACSRSIFREANMNSHSLSTRVHGTENRYSRSGSRLQTARASKLFQIAFRVSRPGLRRFFTADQFAQNSPHARFRKGRSQAA